MRIGLTYTGSDEKHQNYINWLKGDDNIEIVKLSAKENKPSDLMHCDALVLSGGIDIHPEMYGGTTDYSKKPESGWDKERDVFERTILQHAIDRSIPVLGICRGMQLINVHFNGSLVQNLGEDLNKVHEGNPDKSHVVRVEQDTILSDITGTKETQINSAHHQAVDKLGEGLLINAKAMDGTVEGLEWAERSGKPFLLAVQWHPERMFRFHLENTPASKTIRQKFIEEIKKSGTKK